MKDEEICLKNLQARHEMEMARACEHVGFAYTSEDVSNIAAKQVSENEVRTHFLPLLGKTEAKGYCYCHVCMN